MGEDDQSSTDISEGTTVRMEAVITGIENGAWRTLLANTAVPKPKPPRPSTRVRLDSTTIRPYGLPTPDISDEGPTLEFSGPSTAVDELRLSAPIETFTDSLEQPLLDSLVHSLPNSQTSMTNYHEDCSHSTLEMWYPGFGSSPFPWTDETSEILSYNFDTWDKMHHIGNQDHEYDGAPDTGEDIMQVSSDWQVSGDIPLGW